MNAFELETNILLDPIYTGKMLYSIYNNCLNKKNKTGTRIVLIHTGSLQR